MTGDLARYAASRRDELDSAMLYRALAELEKDPALAGVYRRLSESELKHAAFWEERIRAAGGQPGPAGASWRARTLAWLARRFGAAAILPTMLGREASGGQAYDAQPETAGGAMPGEERSHYRLLQSIAAPGGGQVRGPGGLSGGSLARLEGRHRATSGNALRAAVLGANDGLVSNLSLVMGVAGAALANSTILITGLAGLLAGAASMALGEWLSVQSSRELYGRQLDIEAAELEQAPREEEEELALIYQAKGLDEPSARSLASRLMADREAALDTLVREELGFEPGELGGSAWEAALTSFVLFAIGAALPVLPFAFLTGSAAVGASILVSGVALFALGAGITLLTGRGVLFSGTRQLLFGLAAAALTYGVGRLIGASLG